MKMLFVRPVEMQVGDEIYTGYTGKKSWRKITKITQHSQYRYGIVCGDSWNISAGSKCTYIIKR